MLSSGFQSFRARLIRVQRGRRPRDTSRRHARAAQLVQLPSRCHVSTETLEDRLMLSGTPPTVTAPASATVAENESTPIAPVYFGDIYNVDTGNDSVSLSVSHGSLVVDLQPLSWASGQNSPSMTILGTVDALNTAMGGLAYTPTPGFTGSDSLQITITDPGDNLTSTATVPIAVPPLLIHAPQSWGAVLDEYTPIPGPMSIVDTIASGTSDSLTLSTTTGTISLGSTAGLSFTAGSNDSSSMTVNGTLANLNADIGRGFGYIPDGGSLGSDTLQVSVVDANDNASATVAMPITVSAPPPSIEVLQDEAVGLWVKEDTPGNQIFEAFRTEDPDAVDNSDFLTISATNGTLLPPFGSENCIVTAGAYGSSSVTINGPLGSLASSADVGLRYTPNPGYSGPDTLQVTLYDSLDGLSASNSIGLNVSPGPDVRGPTGLNVPEQSPYTFPGSSFSLIDAAAAGTSDSLSLSDYYGSLTLGSTAGLTFTAGSNGSSSMTVSGTLANLNAALDGLVYAPTQSPTGADDLSVTLSDSGDNSSALSRTYLDRVDEEMISTPVEDVSLNENTSFVFSNGSLSVLGSESATASFSMSVADGTLALASTSGLTFNSGANNSSSMTVTGTLQNINLALNGLVYTPDASYSGSDALACSINEPINIYSPSVPITINAPATVAAPSTVRVDENGVLPFPNDSVAVNDVANVNDSSDSLTLSVGHGDLTVLPILGLTLMAGANDSSSMTIIGTPADLNAALAGLVYTPSPGFNGWDTLALSVGDQLDGLTGTTDVAIAVDAAPSIQVPGPTAVAENTPYTFSGSISVLDATSLGTSDSLTLAVSHGTLTLGSTVGVNFVSGSSGTSSMTITGTLTNLNAALNGLVYTPSAGYRGPDLLQMSVNDSGDNLSGSAAVSITVNAPPTVAAPATASVNENGSWTFSGTISLTDVAAGNNSDSLALSVAHGTLTLATTSGLTFTAGANGGASFTVTGSVANLNAALNGLIYRPTANYIGSDSLAISISDPGDGLSASTSVALTVNNLPAITAPATATVIVTSTLTFSTANKNAVSITDASAGGAVEALTLTATDGTLSLGGTTGITFNSGTNNSASMTIGGTLANLNTALSGLTFKPANIGTATVVLTYRDVGDGLLASATITITVSKGVIKLGAGSTLSLPAAPASIAGDSSNSSLPPDEETTQWAGVTAAVATLYG
jgi:hypothetical protein